MTNLFQVPTIPEQESNWGELAAAAAGCMQTYPFPGFHYAVPASLSDHLANEHIYIFQK